MFMKKQFVSDLKVGDMVDDLFAVKYKKLPQPYQKGYWFEMRVSDKTDEITAKYWSTGNLDEVDRVYNSFKKGDVIHIVGRVNSYLEAKEISINPPTGKISKVEIGNYDPNDFVEKTSKDIEKMYNELMTFANSVKNLEIKKILDVFFVEDKNFIDEFKKAPAAMHLHQNVIGGLIEHTLNVTKICDVISTIYPDLNRDILIASALLHDIGKIREFEVNTSIDVSEEGMLKGHITIGNEMLNEKMKALGTPKQLCLKMSHMMLSQHGKKENGSPIQPQLPEAVALFYADDCDSKVFQYLKMKKEAKTEDPWVYSKRLGHVYLR